MNKSVVIIGRIGSGKSTLANSVNEILPSSSLIISFGGYLKNYCTVRDMEFDRTILQDLGQRFIEDDPAKFLKEVVKYSQPDKKVILIFEGIRHKSIYELIKLSYTNLISIYLDMDAKTRYERYKSRINKIDRQNTFDDFLEQDSHNVELEVDSLKSMCDLILKDGSLEENLNKVKQHLRV